MIRSANRVLVPALAAVCAALVAGCGSSGTSGTPQSRAAVPTSTAPSSPTYSAPSATLPTTSPAATSAPRTTAHSAASTTPAPVRTTSAPRTTSAAPPPPNAGAPVIVIDPGHSPTVHATDPATGLNVSDYENEPEMRDVFAVAELVRAKLAAAGYRVYLTKSSATSVASLGDRPALANRVHADLALSIHDQAGANGGLAFSSANNNVYYQSVGTYRETPSGHKVYFTDSRVAAVSRNYGAIFQQQRAAVEHHPVRLLGNTGYDLGSRGLPAGDIWMVQLLSHVPWIYNEAGGNSAGRVGLSAADEQTYADGLVAGVEHCIAPPR